MSYVLHLLLALTAILSTFTPAQAQELRNSHERGVLISRGLSQDNELEARFSLFQFQEKGPPKGFHLWSKATKFAWVQAQKSTFSRLLEITQERTRNLSLLYCTEFDRKNSAGIYALRSVEITLEIYVKTWPHPQESLRDNISMFPKMMDHLHNKVSEAGLAVFHSYAVLDGWGSDCTVPPELE